MVLASTAVFGAVRRARGVTEEFEGFPLEGDRLWIKKKKKLLVPLKQAYLKMADKRHVFDTSPEASESKMPVAIFWNSSKVRI